MEKQQILNKLVPLYNALDKVSVQGKENIIALADSMVFLSQFIEEITQNNPKQEDIES